MSRIPTVGFLRLSASLDAGWLCSCLSRAVLLLVAVELITMPLTQHYWMWDKFMHGGQDFELGLLMVVTCVCFALLRAQHCRQNLRWLLAMGTFLLLTIQRRDPIRLQRFGRVPADADDPLSDGPAVLQSLPLLT